MASVSLPFMVHSHYLSCGATRSSRFCASVNNIGERLECSPKSMDIAEKHFMREVSQFGRRNSCQHYALNALPAADTFVFQNLVKVSSFLFRTENKGQLKVLVDKKNGKYIVHVEVISLQAFGIENELALIWGLYRSDSSCFMPLNLQRSDQNDKQNTVETPFKKNPSGKIVVELEFEPSLAPFYISFLLKCKLNLTSSSIEVRSPRKTNLVVPVGFSSGHTTPLGISVSADGSVNFSLFSQSAKSMVLCLFDDPRKRKPALEIDLDPYVNRTGDIWHTSIDGPLPFVRYGYRCKGDNQGKAEYVILDPYAKIVGEFIPAQQDSDLLPKSLGILRTGTAFDWSTDVLPCLPMEKLIVYRLNVMQFTKDKSSKLPPQILGTFAGVTKKLQHLKDLGINAVLLEPIFPFDEQKGPYFPWHFFSPTSLYESPHDKQSVSNSMKEMVKTFHANGMEVLLEVAFTRTAEDMSLSQIDNFSYYHNGGQDLNGKNALNCNYPVVQQLVLDSLRHWVVEFHIDGFCFSNAASLLQGFNKDVLLRPPLVEAIAFDPLLSQVKIIADSFDPYNLEPKDIKFPHWRRWAEINQKFCDDIRNFLRGKGLLSDLATRLCGSGDIFSDGRGPAFSFNFIARNFGLSLVDLVSYSNVAIASQLSWNCGEEGPTNKASVLQLRLKQIRNFLFILFISLGVPVLNMGDECGQSSDGSPYLEKPLNWDALKTPFGIQITEFISFLSSLRRRRSDILQRKNFMKVENIEWHGSNLSPPSWDEPSSKFLAMTLKAETEVSESGDTEGHLFIAFNAADHPESVVLPEPPAIGAADTAWFCLVDTALPLPGFFTAEGVPVEDDVAEYEMKPHSCALFEAKTATG
ncbi:amylase [Lithospermum erythrorhizon]|uniref:Amylase n=1 Tax=Lithospermum erythrorhizon TaxID=34254 RepID=A0AAV3R2L6_LITER